jgi:hypothetical protein
VPTGAQTSTAAIPLSPGGERPPAPRADSSPAQSQAATTDAGVESARTWIGREAEIEAFLRSARVVSREQIPVGVTRPQRCRLAPGGPVDEMAWKAIQPGFYNGYWESYKAEIAAYELDKLLGLGMVPPTVEKQIDGVAGAAVMWARPTKSFKQLGGVPTPPPAHLASWTRQLVRAKMFDNLIGNRDPNLGNWLVDPAWNLILIDHTRSFGTRRELTHELTRVDGPLWDRMLALTEAPLRDALSSWLARGEIRAILARRDRMRELVDRLIRTHGEAAVILR